MSLLVSVVVGVAVARQLGPSALGVYGAVTAATTFLTLIVTFRLELHLVTQLQNDERDRSIYIPTLVASYLVALPVGGIAEAIDLFAVHGAVRTPLAIDIIEVVVAPLLFRRVVLQVRSQMGRLAVAQSSGRATWLASAFALLLVKPGAILAWIMVARAFSILVEGIILSIFAPLQRRGDREWRIGTALTNLRSSIYLVLGGLAGTGYNRIDQILLTSLKGTLVNGSYTAAVRLGELPGVIAPIMQSVTMPGLVELARRGDDRRLIEGLVDSLLLILVPAGLGVALLMAFPDQFLRIVYGQRFASASLSLVVLAAAEWTTLPAMAYMSAALALGDRRSTFLSSVGGLGVNVVLLMALVGRYGSTGAAWASLAAYAAATVIQALTGVGVRRVAMRTFPLVLRAGLVVLCSVEISHVPGIPWEALAVLLSVAYLGMAWFIDIRSSTRLWRAAIALVARRKAVASSP